MVIDNEIFSKKKKILFKKKIKKKKNCTKIIKKK